MPDFIYPGSEPAEFEPVVLANAEGAYVTLVLRNHRTVRVGDPADRPVLVRECLDDDAWQALLDRLCERLSLVPGLSLCFAGDGFDPSSVPPGDEEALESSAAWAAVLFVPPGGVEILREVVAGVLGDHGLPNAWLLPVVDDHVHGIVVYSS